MVFSQAIKAKSMLPYNLFLLPQGFGLESRTKSNMLSVWSNNALLFIRMDWIWTALWGLAGVARECGFRFDFGFVHVCFSFHSSHMKSSSGLNRVSTLMQSHLSNPIKVALSVWPLICSYHLTLRLMGNNRIVALLRYCGVKSIARWPILIHQVVQAFTW